MKNLILALCALSFTLNSHALIIQGEESYEHFLQVKAEGDRYAFYDCAGPFDNFVCKNFYSDEATFSKTDIEKMAKKKKTHMYLAVGADIALLIAAIRAPVLGAKLEQAWAVSAGYNLEGGVGVVSFVGTGLFVSPAIVSTGAIFDALDPFVHRDLSLSLDAIIGNADFGDLDDIEAQDLSFDRLVTIEDVTTDQVKESFMKMLDSFRKSGQKRTLNLGILGGPVQIN